MFATNNARLYLDLSTRESVTSDAVHVINITVKDNHEEAIIGSMQVYDFLMMVMPSYLQQQIHLFVTRELLLTFDYDVSYSTIIQVPYYKIEFIVQCSANLNDC
jgi:hypothetical protein